MKDKLKSALSVIAVYMPVFIIKLRYLFRFGRFPNLKKDRFLYRSFLLLSLLLHKNFSNTYKIKNAYKSKLHQL